MLTTVAIPFFNARATLADAIRSVFAQSTADWELLLLDDGSTDGSVEIARSVTDPRVKFFHDGMNRGVGHRRNQAIALARGRYIAWLDDDDMMQPQRLATQTLHLQRNPHIDVLGSSAYTIDLEGKVSGWRAANAEDLTGPKILRTCVLLQPTVMATADWSRRNLYDEAFLRGQDHELFCRTFPHTNFSSVPDRLIYYREGRSRTVAKYRKGCHWSRQVFSMYGPKMIGRLESAKLVARSYLKEAVYSALWRFNREEAVIRLNRIPLDSTEARAAHETLARIRATPVPGLERVQPPTAAKVSGQTR